MVTNEDDLLNAIAVLDLMHLVDHGGVVLGIAGIDFHPNRTTLRIADQPDDHLLTVLLTIAVITKGDQLAVLVVAFKIHAGDVIENQMPMAEMTPREGCLNGALAL